MSKWWIKFGTLNPALALNVRIGRKLCGSTSPRMVVISKDNGLTARYIMAALLTVKEHALFSFICL